MNPIPSSWHGLSLYSIAKKNSLCITADYFGLSTSELFGLGYVSSDLIPGLRARAQTRSSSSFTSGAHSVSLFVVFYDNQFFQEQLESPPPPIQNFFGSESILRTFFFVEGLNGDLHF